MEGWRLHVLIEAGYPLSLAEKLAVSGADLHAGGRTSSAAAAIRSSPQRFFFSPASAIRFADHGSAPADPCAQPPEGGPPSRPAGVAVRRSRRSSLPPASLSPLKAVAFAAPGVGDGVRVG